MDLNNKSFEFSSYNFDSTNRKVEFKYVLNTTEAIEFTETLYLPEGMATDIPPQLLDQILHSIHIMLGISYWKLYCPKQIVIKTAQLGKAQADFWNTVYTKGLGEFFYKNKIDFKNLVVFPYQESTTTQPISFPRKNRSLVGIGGGKDSIVTAEILKKAGKDFATIIIETQKPHHISTEVAQLIDKDNLVIQRQVDPKLFELNNDPNAFNGHIPISAVFAFVGILAAVLYDYSYVVVSNERSANYGNTEYLGEMINHQWSKTIEFEQLFQQYIKSFVTPDVTYFSLLRGLSEYKIAELFTQFPDYFNVFSSCNKNYAINKDLPTTNWCGDCPKCAFVFILFAAFLSKEQVVGIFGQDLLAKDTLMDTYKELLGMSGVKPFECVGTPEEVKLAFYKAHTKGEYTNSNVMKIFVNEVLPSLQNVTQLENEILATGEDLVPEEFKKII